MGGRGRKRSTQVLPREWIMTRSFGIAWGSGLTYPNLRKGWSRGASEGWRATHTNTHTHTQLEKPYCTVKDRTTLISLNPRCRAAAYEFYVLSALLIVEWFTGFSRAHLFLNNEVFVSARQKWFIPPPFCCALTSSTCQKNPKCMTKHVPIRFHCHYPPIIFKTVSQLSS